MQKTLIQIVAQVANEINLPTPTTVISSQDQNILKLYALTNAVCDDLLAEFDWNYLQKRYTFSTTNGQSVYAFPSNFSRAIDGTFFDLTNRWPLKGSLTPTQWEIVNTTSISAGPFERFRVMNGQISLYPTPSTTTYTFVFDYISNGVVIDANTAATKAAFTQDSDICAFDHRLVIYGVKLKYLMGIGQPVEGAVRDYSRALQLAKGHDVPGPRLSLVGSHQQLLSTANYTDGNWTAV